SPPTRPATWSDPGRRARLGEPAAHGLDELLGLGADRGHRAARGLEHDHLPHGLPGPLEVLVLLGPDLADRPRPAVLEVTVRQVVGQLGDGLPVRVVEGLSHGY